jgi:hypothetical protein
MLKSLATLYSMLHGDTEDIFGLEIWRKGPQDQAQVDLTSEGYPTGLSALI